MISYIKRKIFYKYKLKDSYYFVQTNILGYEIGSSYLVLDIKGVLLILHNYSWDGGTGTRDTKSFMRASLVHDALYQLLRLGLLPQRCRLEVDKLMRELAIEDGMSRLRAEWLYRGVRLFGGSSAAYTGKAPPKVYTAP